jgi:lipopolysaccharide export system permease protein
MSLLHRHLFFAVLGSCAAAVGLFGFVLIVGNALKDLLQLVLGGQISPETFVTLLVLLAPFVAAYALPMGVLTGVLLVLGRMSAQHEITAMRAAGLSVGYIARPIFVLGALAALLAAFVNFEYMPRARAAYKEALARSVQVNPLSFIVPKTFIRDFPGVVLYIGEKEGATLREVWLWELDKQNRVRRSGRAAEGKVKFSDDDGRLILTLSRVSLEWRNAQAPEDFSVPVRTGTAGEFPIELALETLFGKQAPRKKVAWMTWGELRAERARWEGIRRTEPTREEESRRELMRVSYAVNEKGSTALAVFAFAVLAVPLGIKVSRKETSANLGLALALVMGYYFLTVCVGWLDKRPELRPDLLLWIPALGFLATAAVLLRRLGRV